MGQGIQVDSRVVLLEMTSTNMVVRQVFVNSLGIPSVRKRSEDEEESGVVLTGITRQVLPCPKKVVNG